MGYRGENGHHTSSHSLRPPVIRKSKLVVVDLAGSERIDKSGMWNYTLLSVLSIQGFSVNPNLQGTNLVGYSIAVTFSLVLIF
jgi:hypothetical protein